MRAFLRGGSKRGHADKENVLGARPRMAVPALKKRVVKKTPARAVLGEQDLNSERRSGASAPNKRRPTKAKAAPIVELPDSPEVEVVAAAAAAEGKEKGQRKVKREAEVVVEKTPMRAPRGSVADQTPATAKTVGGEASPLPKSPASKRTKVEASTPAAAADSAGNDIVNMDEDNDDDVEMVDAAPARPAASPAGDVKTPVVSRRRSSVGGRASTNGQLSAWRRDSLAGMPAVPDFDDSVGYCAAIPVQLPASKRLEKLVHMALEAQIALTSTQRDLPDGFAKGFKKVARAVQKQLEHTLAAQMEPDPAIELAARKQELAKREQFVRMAIDDYRAQADSWARAAEQTKAVADACIDAQQTLVDEEGLPDYLSTEDRALLLGSCGKMISQDLPKAVEGLMLDCDELSTILRRQHAFLEQSHGLIQTIAERTQMAAFDDVVAFEAPSMLVQALMRR